MFNAVTKNGGTVFSILVRVVGQLGAAFVLHRTVRSNRVPLVKLRIFLFNLIHHLVHSCQQKSIGLKFPNSQTGSDVRYSCHHISSRFTFLIFAHSCRFSVLHSYNQSHRVYRVSQEKRAELRESVPYVKLYRYNPKHLYPKLNGYGDNGLRSLKF